MRKPRRVTQADYLAAGRGLARDVAEGLAAIEARKLAHASPDGVAPEPDYPGAAVRITYLMQSGLIGDVRIMDYGKGSKTRYRVASFCPGYETCYPGDTPKMNPDRDEWCDTLAEAGVFFDIYVASNKVAGWTVVSPTGRRLVDVEVPL